MLKIIIFVVVFTAVATACFAGWDRKTRPAMTVLQAAKLAQKALGPEADRYYCVEATLGTNGLGVGFWSFDFANTNGHQRVIFVGFDGRTRPMPKVQ